VIGEAGGDASAFAPARGQAGANPTGMDGSAVPNQIVKHAAGGTAAKDAKQQENYAQVRETAGDSYFESSAALPDESKRQKEAPRVSPRAMRLAERAGLDASEAKGTGPGGRVIERDVEALIGSGKNGGESALPRLEKAAEKAGRKLNIQAEPIPSQAEGRFERHSGIRKAIARTMVESLRTQAQLTLNASLDATDLLAFRKKLKDGDGDAKKITVGDMVAYAVSRVILRHGSLNAHYSDEGTTLFSQVNLGVAVDTERGLMVPTIFGADKLSLTEISSGIRDAAADCRSGGISPDRLAGGTFTLTNLGALGVESFTPVINPPQTAILGVCAVTERARDAGGRVSVYPAMGLSLTFDHRAVDGAPAARFLADIVKYLEDLRSNLALEHI